MRKTLRGGEEEALARSRTSGWRRRPGDPRTAWGWVFWNEFRLPFAQRRMLRWAIPLVVAMTVGAGFALDFSGVLFVGLIGLVGLLVYARPGAREHAALPTLGEDASFPVVLELSQRGTRLGREAGWVAFVDGWLVYEGLRTSFSLRPDAVCSSVAFTGGMLRMELADRTAVRLYLLTDFMQTQSPARWRDAKRLREAFRVWREGAPPEGKALLPPRIESPAAIGSDLGQILVAAGFSGFAMLILLGMGQATFATLPAALFALCVLRFGGIFRRFDARLREEAFSDGDQTPRVTGD